MKTLKILLLVLSIFLFTDSALKNQPIDPATIKYVLENHTLDSVNYETKGDLYDFMHVIGKKESGGNYKIVNRYGCLGKYQFCSLRNVPEAKSATHFLNNPDIQDRAMVSLLKRNKNYLQPYIDEYAGNLLIDGVIITESGILAGAHLAGPGGVERYLKYRKNGKDAFGTSVTYYMKKFSGYKLEL
jgi:hypothetical protein